MLHIILALLKIIGILLVTILGLILLAVLLVLFVPVRYRVSFLRKKEELSAGGEVSWLFRLVLVKVQYEKGKDLDREVYLVGIPVLKMMEKRKRRAAERAAAPKAERRQQRAESNALPEPPAADKAQESAQPILTAEESGQKESIESAEKFEEAPSVSHDTVWEKTERLLRSACRAVGGVLRKIFSIPSRIRKTFSKFRLTVRRICGKIRQWSSFLKSPELRAALRAVMRNGKKLLMHIRPRNIRGSVHFGFDDPARTGQLLAGVSLIFPVLPRKLAVIPDFEKPVLEADVSARGRIYGIIILKLAVQTYLQSNIKTIIKQYKEAF